MLSSLVHIFVATVFCWTQRSAITRVAAASLTKDEIEATRTKLKAAQVAMNENASQFCYGTGHSNTKHNFVSNRWEPFVGNLNVLAYSFCGTTNELGNRLGNFFTELACADASGVNFITVHFDWDLIGSHHVNQTEANKIFENRKHAFLTGLPDVIVHENPVADRGAAVTQIQHHCKCTRYCWGHINAPWVNRTALIGKYMFEAINAYWKNVGKDEYTVISPDVDVTNAKAGEHLPIVPDVALQYRCGDNIGFSYMYGVLPFTAFDDKIPKDAKYIYVLSDHPTRSAHSPYSGRCQLILQGLFEYLKERHPTSTIVVKRGGDIFLDYVRFAMAKVTICSASSYCFWPSLGAVHNKGIVHFPVTSLIAGADSIDLAPDFGPNFRWIAKPEIISNFNKVRPWTNIVQILQGKMEMP